MGIKLFVVGVFAVLIVAMLGYIAGGVVRYVVDNATSKTAVCETAPTYSIPQGFINMSQGARLEGVTLYNLTLYAADDNYTMKSVYGKNFAMIVNGSRIR
jgi:uncharacterized membrane protein YiaA